MAGGGVFRVVQKRICIPSVVHILFVKFRPKIFVSYALPRRRFIEGQLKSIIPTERISNFGFIPTKSSNTALNLKQPLQCYRIENVKRSQ